MLCTYDASPRPLTQKILERPRLLQRIRYAVHDRSRAYLTVFNSTPLERRLADSSASGYTGELTLNFFRSGLRLVFDQGRLTDAADFRGEGWNPQYNAGFPPLVFLQLLFGRRSLA